MGQIFRSELLNISLGSLKEPNGFWHVSSDCQRAGPPVTQKGYGQSEIIERTEPGVKQIRQAFHRAIDVLGSGGGRTGCGGEARRKAHSLLMRKELELG